MQNYSTPPQSLVSFSPRLRGEILVTPQNSNPPFQVGEWLVRPASLRLCEPGLVLLFDAIEVRQQAMIRICLQLF